MSDSRNPSYKRLRCTIIGAGVSGILMAYKLQQHLKEYVDITILEKSPELGGTWYENRYPGCACDVPSHCYQFPFAPNPDWSKFYASSSEIKDYLQSVASHFRIDQYIRFNTKVVLARWSDTTSTWMVNSDDGLSFESEILFNAGGILNNPQYPSIPGLSDFAGPILHTAAWDDSVQLAGKRIGIIGAGASAVQLLPQIQPLAEKIDMYIRTPSWISPAVAVPDEKRADQLYRVDEKLKFRTDEDHYLTERKVLESQFNGMFQAFMKLSPEQQDLRNRFEARMKTLLLDESLHDKLIPKFEAGCRRINPGEQYLVSLQEPNVEPVFDGIECITSNSIRAGGQEREIDILVAATGFNTTFKPRFPIFGRAETNLQDLWVSDPVSYMGTGVSGFPNYFTFLGPNTPISNGSLMGPIEATGDYFIRIISKMVRQRVRSVDVRPDAQKDFNDHTQIFMKDMVWTGSCRSWFKSGTNSKVTALWPGSSLHYMQCLAEDRWEDYYWTYDEERFAYWGRGLSWVESPEQDRLGLQTREYHRSMTTLPNKGSDLSFYLQKAPPIPRRIESAEPPVVLAGGMMEATEKNAGGGDVTPDSGLALSLDGDHPESKDIDMGGTGFTEEISVKQRETRVQVVT